MGRVVRVASEVTLRSHRVTDDAEDVADLAAQENQGQDRDDGDEGEDQRVLREALPFLVTIEEIDDGGVNLKHLGLPPFIRDPQPGREIPHPREESVRNRRRPTRSCQQIPSKLSTCCNGLAWAPPLVRVREAAASVVDRFRPTRLRAGG